MEAERSLRFWLHARVYVFRASAPSTGTETGARTGKEPAGKTPVVRRSLPAAFPEAR